jgi:hypothetical protein
MYQRRGDEWAESMFVRAVELDMCAELMFELYVTLRGLLTLELELELEFELVDAPLDALRDAPLEAQRDALCMRTSSFWFRTRRVSGLIGRCWTHPARKRLSNQWPPALELSRRNTAYRLGKRLRVHGSGSLWYSGIALDLACDKKHWGVSG